MSRRVEGGRLRLAVEAGAEITQAPAGDDATTVIVRPGRAGGTEQVAERIRAHAAGMRFLGADGCLLPRLTVSIGVAVFPVRTSSPEDRVGHADAALYAAKRAGKDRVETYA